MPKLVSVLIQTFWCN